MLPAAWQVFSWNPVLIRIPDFEHLTDILHPIDVAVTAHGVDHLRSGQAFWAGELDGNRIGIAWDWAELQRDVLTLLDPMKLISNVKLVSDEGNCLSESETILYLNCMVHDLPWQAHVSIAAFH